MTFARLAGRMALLSFLTLPAALSGAHAADNVLARVNGKEIRSGDAKLAMQDIGRTLPRRMSAAQRSAYTLNYLIDLHLAALKAEQDRLHDSAEFKKKMEYFRRKALMEAYIDAVSRKAVDATKVKAAYDEAAKGHKPETEVNASHILVKTRPEAEAALKRVRGGEDFAKVAREISKDPGSPGGKLGWFTRKRMVPPFAEAAFKTRPGTISEPVQTRFGWHIIKVIAQRKTEFPKFEQVRGQIRQYLIRRAQSEAVKTLRKEAKIEKLNAAP